MALASVDVTPAAEQVCRQVAAWAAEPPPSAALSRAATEQPAVPPRAARVALWRAHARLAAEADEERTGGALEALAALKQLDGLCFDALAHVQRASSCLDLVAQRHAGLETQSAALQQQTSAQQETLAGLQALANALDVRLGPFRALATHRRLLEAPGLPATHPGLLPALEALDRAISDVASSASAARDSSELLAELRVLQASGLRAIAAHVSGALHSVASSAAVALREWAAEPPAGAGAAAGGEQPQGRGTAAAVPLPLLTPTDGPFAQAVHVRFHAVGTTLRPWLEQLERRAPLHREAAAVLLEAHGAYLAARTPLLRTALSAMLSRLSRSLASSAGCNADAGSAAAPASPAASATDLAHAAARVSAEQLADAARRAIAWFGRVVTLERELHEAVFRPEALLLKGAVLAGAGAGGAAGSGARGMGAALNAALERALCGVCMLLADWLRPAVLQADGVEGLADLALALREEAVSADSLGGALEPAPLAASCSSSPLSAAAAAVPGGTSAASVLSVTSVTSVPSVGSAGSALLAAASSSSALSLAIARALGDVQGRLAFRAQVEIRDRVRAFRPTAQDLEYPDLLIRARDAAVAAARAKARAAPGASDGAAASAEAEGGGDDATRDAAGARLAERAGPAAQYEVPWYPPVDAALRCLAVLYRAVDRFTFSSIAAEAVAEATAALIDGSRRVSERAGDLDGRLFLVRQLLTLREQLAPFDANWEVVEKTLDLSSMRGWLLSELRSRRALARPLAFVRAMLTSNRPAVIESHKDAKAWLEAELKGACEGLIGHVSAELTQPLLPFLASYGAAAGADGSGEAGGGAAEAEAHAALPSADECAAALAQTVSCIESRLPALHGSLSLYLNNPLTLAILFRPIKAAVLDALQQYAAVAQRAMPDAQRDAQDVSGQLERVRSALDACG